MDYFIIHNPKKKGIPWDIKNGTNVIQWSVVSGPYSSLSAAELAIEKLKCFYSEINPIKIERELVGKVINK